MAVARPDNVMAMDDLRTAIGRDIHTVVACESQIDAYIERLYTRNESPSGAHGRPPRGEGGGKANSRGAAHAPAEVQVDEEAEAVDIAEAAAEALADAPEDDAAALAADIDLPDRGRSRS